MSTAHMLLLFTGPVGAVLIFLFLYWYDRPSARRN
jgi:hypothetical protein